MMHRNKVVAVALSLLLASSALSSVAMAQNADRANREDVQQLINEVNRLAEKARALLVRAEQQNNSVAIDAIHTAMKWLSEARSLIENGELERAKAAISEASNHLNKAEKLLANNDGDRNEIMTKAKRLMERAMKLQSIAKSQNNERALEVLDKAISLIEEAVRTATNGNTREANMMLDEASKMLNAVEAMLSATTSNITPSNTDDIKENIIRKAKALMERARTLVPIAEEQGNEEAVEVLKEIIQLLEEVIREAENGNLRVANAKLAEATQMLNRVAAALTGSINRPTPRPIPEDPTNALIRIAEELESKAKRIMTVAEEQGNREAYVEAEVGLKLVAEAKRLINAGNYDDAKSKLREANDHLSKAAGLLQPEQVIAAEKTVGFIKDRPAAVETVSEIFKTRFGLYGNGYAVIKTPNTARDLYVTEISMQGAVLEDREPGIHFIVRDVVITAHANAALTARDDKITLTSVDAWDGKARNRVFFTTNGAVQDEEGNTYRVHLRALLIDISDQGLLYKVDGRIHHMDRTNVDQNYLFAHLHYLAIVKTVA